MSRWSDPPSGESRSIRAAIGTLLPAILLPGTLVLAILMAAILPGMAAADPQPSAPVLDVRAPVQPVTAPVLDIVTSVSDTGHEVIVDQSARRVRVTLDATVLFGKDSAVVRPGGAEPVEQAVATIRLRGSGRVRIVGYTDDLGSAEHGLVLSRRRAAAVALIVGRELPAARYPLVAVGKGEDDPAAPNTSEANRRRNRRVVITYEPG